ncbi:MAG: Gfo/Idh/MocA family oxidoreductase [Nitrospirae bacterium]|nr:Gfo/Idh/MocA family oxidoreductase [Nitrospirota bacterium]MCL5976739.1 Gfo/Idh/MocA family oxidoreductase [Nitrospirota bacterium]
MKPVNVAVVGLGYWGPNLARNIVSCSSTELCCLCDYNINRLKKVGSSYQSVKKTTDIFEVISDESIEAVVIATPVDTHFELAKASLAAGKHVLLEKPMTRTVKQAEILIELAEKKNVTLTVGHTFNYTSAVRKIKEIILSGELGEILYWDSVRINLGLFQHDVNVVWDLAPHDLAMLDYILAHKPISVQTFGVAHFSDNIENIAYMILRFDNNMIAHFTFNWLAPVKIRMTIVGGSQKMLVFNDMEPSEKLKIYDKGVDVAATKDNIYKRLVQYRVGNMYAPQIDNIEALNTEIEHFAQVVRHKAKPISGAEEGLRVVKLLEAAEKSIKRKGKEIIL